MLADLVAVGDATETPASLGARSRRASRRSPAATSSATTGSSATSTSCDRLAQRAGARSGRSAHGRRARSGSGSWSRPLRTGVTTSCSPSSLPVFVPGGLHGIQQWNEAVCDGGLGTHGRPARRAVAPDSTSRAGRRSPFVRRARVDLLDERATTVTGRDGRRHRRPLIGGDIHFAYVATIDVGDGVRVRQVVSSPMRNALATVERGAIHFASGRVGAVIGRTLARLVGRGARTHRFHLDEGPYFNNNIGLLDVSVCVAGAGAGGAITSRRRRTRPRDGHRPRALIPHAANQVAPQV